MNWKLFELVLNAIALAMGVACIVLSVLNAVPTQAIVLLLAIGLSALALNQFDIHEGGAE